MVTSPIDYASPSGRPRTAGLAITALVLGIVGIVTSCVGIGLLLGIAAVILGVIALGQTKQPQVQGRGMAIGGIGTGVVAVLATIALGVMWFALTVPVLNSARNTAIKIQCASNLRMIGLGTILYANEQPGGVFPQDMQAILDTQDIQAQVFVCPSTAHARAADGTLTLGTSLSYVWLNPPANEEPMTYEAGAETPLAVEPLSNHGDGANVLWADAHVDFESAADVRQIVADALGRGQIDQATADLVLDVPAAGP